MVAATPQSPYRGLIPYQEEDEPFFFGRKTETRLVIASLFAAPLTLLYGSSGVGKSSVLRAGAAYELRKRDDVLVVVFNTWQTNPVGQLKEAIKSTATGIGASSEAVGDDSRLGDYLHEYAERLDRRLILILDQFEEYFTYYPRTKDFGDQLPAALSQNADELGVLISIREDSLARLDVFEGDIPNLFDNYLRIEHLDREAAREAIEKPVDVYNEQVAPPGGKVQIGEGLVEKVLEQVRSGQLSLGEIGHGAVTGDPAERRVETPLLQLVMTRLWQEEVSEGSRELRVLTLDRLGGAERIVKTHLDQAMSTLSPADRRAAAGVFHYLVTPSGTKIAHSASDLAEYSSLPRPQIAQMLDELSGEERILRAVAPDRPDGETRFEIFHDVLAPAILDWRTRYLLEAERDLTPMQRQADLWDQQKGDAGFLLTDQALAEADQWARENPDQLRPKDIAFLRACVEAQKARERDARINRLVRGLAVVSTLVGLMAIVAFVIALYFFVEAKASARLAEEQTLFATQQERLAKVRELSASAISQLGVDPQRALLLALHAAMQTYEADREIGPEAQDALYRGVHASKLTLTVSGHEKTVRAAAFSPDGTRLATASEDATARVWDSASGGELLTLRHDDGVTAVAYSRDGRLIATGSWDNSVRLWDAASGQNSRTISNLPGDVYTVAFSPDGTRLAAAGVDGIVRLWDVANDQPAREICRSPNPIANVAFAPDSRRLAIASWDAKARICDIQSGQMVLEFTGLYELPLTSVTFSPDGTMLATASHDKTVNLWDATTGFHLLTLSGHRLPAYDVAFSPDGAVLATASEDGTARIWSAQSGQEILTLTGHTNAVLGIVFDSSGTRVATVSADKAAKIWAVTVPHVDTVTRVAFSPAGDRVGTASADGTARIWNVASGQLEYTFAGHGRDVTSLAFSPDGSRVATSSADGAARLWDSRTGQQLLLITGHVFGDFISVAQVTDVAFSPDGRYLATASTDLSAKLWDAASGNQVWTTTENHAARVNSVALSGDGRYLATASSDGTVGVWRPDLGRGVPGQAPKVAALYGYSFEVYRVAFSPDSTRLAAATAGGMSIVWETQSWQELMQLTHEGPVKSIAFDSSGTRILTASADGTAKIWDAVTGQELTTLRGHAGSVETAAFSPDGTRIATGGTDKSFRVYPLDQRELIEQARRQATRTLSPVECQRYLVPQPCPRRF